MKENTSEAAKRKRRSGKSAKPEEVVEYLTEVMRGDTSSSARLKAAELLGKKYGIFSERPTGLDIKPVVISGDNDLEDV
ncbi:MAG: hypothetical protein FWH04_08240 [Oscillospiraceae bacterium]|nr:hypothetical protein [Oscillospiraceae bacterium]